MKLFKRKLVVPILIILIIISGSLISYKIYTDSYYKSNQTIETISKTFSNILIEKSDDMITFKTNNLTNISKNGIIFYPGAKVDYDAYPELMSKIASYGYIAVVPKMPLNLAILGTNKANEIIEKFPEVENWTIIGHSLGGTAAATYINNNPGKISNLVLLGSYPSDDISNIENLKVLSIYGSEDEVLNKENFENTKSKLPKDTQYIKIPGGNHAYFGNYGEQKNDGYASITHIEQQDFTIEKIINFIKN